MDATPRNTVHEGHGVSKALLEELQKDIAAMRTDAGTGFVVKVFLVLCPYLCLFHYFCLVDYHERVVSDFSSVVCFVDYIIQMSV